MQCLVHCSAVDARQMYKWYILDHWPTAFSPTYVLIRTCARFTSSLSSVHHPPQPTIMIRTIYETIMLLHVRLDWGLLPIFTQLQQQLLQSLAQMSKLDTLF